MKTHVIDGVTYVEVDREAKEGDKIISKLTGNIFDIILDGRSGKAFIQGGSYILKDYYNVLEPLDSEEATIDDTQASEQVIEMFAALSRKIVSLEQQLADTQRNVERQAEELAGLENVVREDLLRLRDDINSTHRKLEMLTDDIVTLDERSQILSAINKYYAEGSR